MRMMTKGSRITIEAHVAMVVMLGSLASPARAQSAPGAIANGSVAAAVDGGGTDVSVAGSLGFRFNRVLGIGVELTWMNLKATTPSAVTSPYTSLVYSNARSDTLLFTTNMRVEIPTSSWRILPYAVGGGGAAGTTNRYTVTIRTSFPPLPLGSIPSGVVIPIPIPQSESQAVNASSTGLALTLGGGVSLLATRHISVDIDLRSFYIRGNPSGSIGRFGVGTSYRF
jgi:opacity protein-like surface antigen